MKKVLICVVGMLVLATAAWSQSTEKAVAALENQWLQSQKTNNVDLLIPLLAEKFINTSSDGKVTGKSETAAEYKITRWTTAENTDVKVAVYGDTAIATGLYHGIGTNAGKPFEEHERWTDTWIKMAGGQWQCVATQGTLVAK
jgi:ketosteroid isomerase-like protein